MNLCLFDLDDTLLPLDSDHAWGEFVIRLFSLLGKNRHCEEAKPTKQSRWNLAQVRPQARDRFVAMLLAMTTVTSCSSIGYPAHRRSDRSARPARSW